MSRNARRIWLVVVALICATVLVAAVRPKAAGTRSLRDAPSDWMLASRSIEEALESDSPRRIELWRATYAHAKSIAPRRVNPDAAFVRSGLFHWFELSEADHALVMKAAEPLMRDPAFFGRMHEPFLRLTRDFGWIRRNAPPTLDARTQLRGLALSRGLFGEYRQLREDVRQLRLASFAERRHKEDPPALLGLLPESLDSSYDPLARGILEEIERQAFDPAKLSAQADAMVVYALDHDLGPLAGLAPLIEAPSPLRDVTRARVALRLDRPSVANRIELASTSSRSAEWIPYYLERARFEARRQEARAADAALVRAASDDLTIPVLAAAADVAHILGKTGDVGRYTEQLRRTPRVWEGVCSPNELCSTARTQEWSADSRRRLIRLETVQSDEIAPYVEIYVDDVRVAEGEVRDSRTFEVPLAEGIDEIEVRLVNSRTRNGVQRRLRLS